MSRKKLSTFEQEMQDAAFKKEFEKEYKEFLWSELLTDLMEEARQSIRGLAAKAGVSPTIIQNLRTGKQADLKVKNLISIAEACGYHLVLENGSNRIELS